MKRTFTLLLAASLVVAFGGVASAHIGGLVFPVFELATEDLPDLHDATSEDWTDVLPGTSLDHNDFAPLNVADGAGINPADLAYRTWLAWNSSDQRLYMAIERVDDVYVNTYEGGDLTGLWRFDSIEFMLDGDHSGGSYNGGGLGDDLSDEERKLLTNFQGQQYVAVAEAPDGRTLGYQGNGQGWVTLPPWADAGGFSEGESPNTSVIEMAVTAWDALNWQGPELSVRSSLVEGKLIGFQISVPDFDTEAGAYHGFHTLSGQPNTWREADNFVDGELIGCEGGDCGADPVDLGTAVEENSWGRIKASFR